jgi:hypothetical protein
MRISFFGLVSTGFGKGGAQGKDWRLIWPIELSERGGDEDCRDRNGVWSRLSLHQVPPRL